MRRRRRLRVRRSLALLLLLAILALLLQLNQFLPGAWPGGEDGGFQRFTVHTVAEDRLRPPEEDLPPLPTEGITIVLRGGGGDAAVAVDAPGATAARPDAQGRTALGDPRLLAAGFVVLDRGEALRHGAADPRAANLWTVHLPETMPAPPGPARSLGLEVVSAEDARPLADAAVTVRSAEGTIRHVTDAEGRVHLEGLAGRAVVEVSAAGRTPTRRWIHARGDEALRFALPRAPRIGTRFLRADGTPATVTQLRLLTPEGQVLWKANPTIQGLPLEIQSDASLKDALLEVWTPDHPVIRVRFADLGDALTLPAGRTIDVDARDEGAQPLRGVRVTARYTPQLLGAAPPDGSEPLDVTVHAAGAAVVVPADRPARLLVEAQASAPRTLDVAAAEAPGRPRIVLAPGASLLVSVRDATGAPVAGASIIALASAEGSTVRREAMTLPDGTARLRELPPGPVEVYAHVRGTAWAAAVVEPEGRNARVDLVLAPGLGLRLVVESPLGLPIEGVRVEAESDGATDLVPPDARPWRTTRDGTLVIPDLHDQSYRLRFSHPSWRTQTISGVRPGQGIHFVTLLPR